MKLRKVVKKIVALGTGVSLVGATLLGAMAAADLKDYPSPFIKDGKFSGMLVVGDKAAAEDVIGVTDIAVSLQYSATKKTAVTSGSSVSVDGDAFKISAAGNDLNLYETIGSVKSIVTRTELAGLKQGSVSNDKGTFTYDQYLELGNSTVTFAKDDNGDGDQDPKIYFKNSAGNLLRYKLTFPTALKSDIDSSRDLDDLDNKKISILGKEYTITNTDFTVGGQLTLEMMGGAVTDTIEGGKTKTYTIGGKDFEVTLNAVTTTTPPKAQLTINSEVTESLEAGQTFTLSDGTQIGIKDVLPTKADSVSADLVTFYLGAQKVKIVDATSTSGPAASTFQIGSNTISDGSADLVWSNSSSEVSLTEIAIVVEPSDSYFVPSGGKISDALKSEEDTVALLKVLNADLLFAGTVPVVTDSIKIEPSGSTNLKLKLKTKSGASLAQDIWWLNGANVNLAKDSAKHVATCERTAADMVGGTSNTSCITTFVAQNGNGLGADDGVSSFLNHAEDEDYFVVETNKYSHLMQVKDFDSANTKITLKDIADGKQEDITVSSTVATFYKDGYQYRLTVDGAYTSVNLTAIAGDTTDSTWNTSNPDIRADLWTEHGAQVRLAPNATIIVEGVGISRDESTTSVHNITIGIVPSSGKLTPSSIISNSPTDASSTNRGDPTISLDSNSDKKEGLTEWGTWLKVDTSGDQDTVELIYPEKEAIANLYVTLGVATTGAAGSTQDSVTVNKIEVGAAKLAKEIQDIKAQNLIVVGGPCANSVASELLGNPADCAAGFEDGKAKIRLFEQANGNVALLVAGYSAEDTRTASQVVANAKDYAGKLTGTNVEVTTASKSVKSMTTTA